MITEWGKIILREVVARPIMPVTTFLIFGIIFSYNYRVELQPVYIFILLISFLLLAAIVRKKSFPFLVIVLLIISFGLGIFCSGLSRSHNSIYERALLGFSNQKTTITGTIINAPERSVKTTHLHIEAVVCETKEIRKKCGGKIIYYIGKDNSALKAGDLVQITATLRDIKDSGNPGEFKYAEYLKNRGFLLRSYLRSSSSVKLIRHNANQGLLTYFHRVRSELSTWINRDEKIKNREILKALVIGMRKAIPEEVRESFLKGGTAHLLAISGLHLGVMSFWIFFLCSFLAKRSTFLIRYITARQMAAAMTIPITWFYAFIAGLHIATFRAAIMITVYLLAQVSWRRSDSVNNLFLAAFIALLIYPYSIFEVGFLLSFTSVLAIVMAAPRITSLLPYKLQKKVQAQNSNFTEKAIAYLYFVALSSLICFFATAPIVLYWFHAISLAGPLINIAIVPIFSLLLIPLLALFVVFWIFGLPFAGSILLLADRIFEFAYQLQQHLVNFVRGLHYLPAYSMLNVFLYYCILLLFLYTIYLPFNFPGRPKSGLWKYFDDKRLFKIGLFVLTTVMLLSATFYPMEISAKNRNLKIIVPHMGNGTCTFLKKPYDELVCAGIDVEDERNVVKRTVAPMIWANGYKEISKLWYSLKREKQKLFKTEIEKYFSFDENGSVYRYCGGGIENGIKHCKLSNSVSLFKMPKRQGKRKKPSVPMLKYKYENNAVLILPSPHLIDQKAWEGFSEYVKGENVKVIMFGPGKVEAFEQMVKSIRPDTVIFAMNKPLARYLSRKNWERMQEILPEIYRTDYDGALALDNSLELVKLADNQ